MVKEPLADDFIHKLMNWKHSGFSVHNKARVARDDEKGTVIYRSRMSHGKNGILHKFSIGFQIYTAAEVIAAITQHIPEKSFQMVRYSSKTWKSVS